MGNNIGTINDLGFRVQRVGNVKTLLPKLQVGVSVKEFGAKGDGVHDDTTAFEAMVTHCAATGATGYLPAGTYLIDPSTRTFSGSKPFKLVGDGPETVLKNSDDESSFIIWTGADGAGFENLTIDASFEGLPSVPSSGGSLVFVNSSDNAVRGVDFRNVWRVAVMIYNDHQTTLANVYGGHVIDQVRVFGPDNYSDNVGPSAILLSDVDNSRITNCYCENVGAYGFEFKNDSNNCLVSDCVAVNTYRAVYFGGDGAHAELKYVKGSRVNNCIIVNSHEPLWLGLADNNAVSNLLIRRTADATFQENRASVAIAGGVGNRVSGVHIVNRNYYAVDIRADGAVASSDNYVEVSLADGTFQNTATNLSGGTHNTATVSYQNH